MLIFQARVLRDEMAEHLHKLKFVFSYVKGLTLSQMQVDVHQFYQT